MQGNESTSQQSPADAGLFAADPVFALSTPGLPAAIALVRMTGKDCIDLLRPCILGVDPVTAKSRYLYKCQLRDPIDNVVVDEPLLAVFRTPHSFTGEDCAELHLHGSPYVVRRTFDILRRLGMNEARAGEFSHRAFLNGKMDLTQAEGLRDLINAQTSDQWQSARQLATGRLRQVIDELRADLVAASAYLEARIDFPDERETAALNLDPTLNKVRSALVKMHQLVDSYDAGKVVQHGLRVALIGPPNAGKSTLLNQLLGRDRAIVSEIPGTTRDYIEESCIIGGHLIRLVDTAGIRNTDDQIEKIGIEHSIRIANESDLILLLVPNDADQGDLSQALDQSKLRRVRTKIDLQGDHQGTFDVAISSHTGEGLFELKNAIVARFAEFNAKLGESVFITNDRHSSAIQASIASLGLFLTAHAEGAFDEMLAFELQEGIRRLQSIVGEIGGDEVLGKIFSEFCVGK